MFDQFIQIENAKGLAKQPKGPFDTSEASSEEAVSPAAIQQRQAKNKFYKRKYTHDGILVKVLEDEAEFYKARITEK